MANKRFATLAGSAFALSVLMAAPVNADMFSDWDTDDEVGISENEFGEGFDTGGVYDTWDADNDDMLTEDEFETGLYDTYDVNDDDVLDEEEFANYQEDEEQGFWDI